MNELISHIEFLLHTHDCVIVPNLGGFVLNVYPVKRDGLAAFEAPECELIFNQNLTYNDGLLVESFMKTEGISFETAHKRVEAGVNALKSALQENETVAFGKLGTFSMNKERRYVFTPDRFIRPEYFGLKKVALQPMIHVQPLPPLEKTQKIRRMAIRNIGIGAAVAITATVILLLSPLNRNSHLRQDANIAWEGSLFKNNAAKRTSLQSMEQTKAIAPTIAIEQPVNEKTVSQPIAENVTSQNSNDTQAQVAIKKYYVVMGVYEVRRVAEEMKAMLESEGFSQTSWLERPGRIDVYAASFTDREAADDFLKKVHSQYPHHRDAWILKY